MVRHFASAIYRSTGEVQELGTRAHHFVEATEQEEELGKVIQGLVGIPERRVMAEVLKDAVADAVDRSDPHIGKISNWSRVS